MTPFEQGIVKLGVIDNLSERKLICIALDIQLSSMSKELKVEKASWSLRSRAYYAI